MQKPFFKKKYKNIKNKLLNDLIKVITNSKKVNIKYLIIPLVDKSSIKNKKEEKCLINNFRKYIAPKLDSLRILFEIDYKPKDVLLFIKKFKSKKFGINYDTGNSASMDYNILDELAYFKFVKNIHIKDRKKFGNTVDLGGGNWNYKLFFEKLKKISYKGNLILQTARSKDNKHVEKVIKNLNFIKKYL
jgi:hexulose-6-phosphate isomerase